MATTLGCEGYERYQRRMRRRRWEVRDADAALPHLHQASPYLTRCGHSVQKYDWRDSSQKLDDQATGFGGVCSGNVLVHRPAIIKDAPSSAYYNVCAMKTRD